ncbi:MAG TPA: SRPBCC family protein [Miltoncostaeaceae bacterium]|nr:SRPBCC family protein [Miltoncostaeaceae bacterium]
MANDFTVSVAVAVRPHEAWALAGDPARVHEWFGPANAIRIDGDLRIVEMASGARLVERLIERNDSGLSYSYEVVEGIPNLIRHRATISVVAHPQGSEIRWRQTAESSDPDYDIEARLRGVMTAGLEQLRDVLEGASGD